ncbi:hypothetical protein RI129_003156 [Pyrocoelia pectoralis]|uniref:DUF7869 domain-containing protein n=1 Tax=Pyrocoelia pectoralis TaxID=417401 RepID=A0AAN7VNT2_9COLE
MFIIYFFKWFNSHIYEKNHKISQTVLKAPVEKFDKDIIDPYETDEESEYEPEDDDESIDSEDPEADGNMDEEHKTPSKTRKRGRREVDWQVNKKKMLRNSGKAYDGNKKKAHLPRNMKLYNHTCRYKCNQNIAETERQDLFDNFYKLASYDLQNSFLSSCIKKKSVARKRNTDNGKQFSTEITLLNKRVCKMFFLKTFDVSNKRFTTVCSKTSSLGICGKDRRGTGPGRKMEQKRRKLVIEHINMFPKYRSHYSRQSNLNTRYLSPELNITTIKAEKATSSKKIDAKEHEDSQNTCVLCFDLQQALATPLITTSKVFYLRQLWTYNFCIHNLVTGKSNIYVWDETVSSRGSQEIGSCLLHFINNALPQNFTKIIFYSDSCGGQNKNKNIVKLFMFLKKATKIEEIHHKFLEPGHTFMECDHDFGIIEKVKRKIPQIFIPEHWRNVIKKSCKKFSVHEMRKEDFYSFSKLNETISDPKKDTDKHVIKWREIQYFFFSKLAESLFCFYFKPTLDVSFPFNKCICPTKVTGRPSLTFQSTFSQLHHDTLKINELKWNNLQTLLEYIPPVYHNFYKNIQYEAKEKKKRMSQTSSSGRGKKKAKIEENQQGVESEEEKDGDSDNVDLILYSDYE